MATLPINPAPIAKGGPAANIPGVPTLPGVPALPGVPSAGAGAIPSSNTTPLGSNVPSISAGLSTKDGSHTVVGDFKDSYGAGTGTALADTLATLGTSTNAAVQATNQSILDAASRQEANIYASNAAAGLSKDSSATALGIGDFESQVSQTLAQTDSQMELSEENLLIQSLFQEGSAHGGDVSGWDTFANVLKGIGSTAGDIAGVFAGDPALGNQVTSLFGGGNNLKSNSGGTLFGGVNELDALVG